MDRKNSILTLGARLCAVDEDALEEGWAPKRFFQQWLQEVGLAGAATIVEVLDGHLASIHNRPLEYPALREERLAHRACVLEELGHIIVSTPHLIAVQARFLAADPVARLIAEKPHWRDRALLAAAAIEYRMPILGASKFYARVHESHPLPGGVQDPRTGDWLVKPT